MDRPRCARAGALAVALVMLAGCASSRPTADAGVPEQRDRAGVPGTGSPTLSPLTLSDRPPPVRTAARFTVEVRDLPLRQVLDRLARESAAVVDVDADVDGRVTLAQEAHAREKEQTVIQVLPGAQGRVYVTGAGRATDLAQLAREGRVLRLVADAPTDRARGRVDAERPRLAPDHDRGFAQDVQALRLSRAQDVERQ